MKPTTKIFIYIGFALAALVFFFYFRFPSEMVRDALSDRIKLNHPQADVDIAHISPTVPPGLKLEALGLSYDEVPIVRMDHLRISPNLISLFTGTKRYNYSGSIGSGKLKGRIDTSADGSRQQSKLAMSLNRVPINLIDIANHWKSFSPEGELDATINFDSLKGGGTADINMEILPAALALEPPVMGIEALTFNQLKAQLVVTQRMLQIRNFDAVGDQIEAKMTGSIVFGQPVEESRITLSLTIKPQPAFVSDHKNDMIGGLLATAGAQKRGVVFRISGTIGNPRYVIR